ncbi:MAG: hypothetical protein KF878_30230 [Planctomycetes bacterium]|nr:hypothetical protein [Planctomycetota bacterium]
MKVADLGQLHGPERSPEPLADVYGQHLGTPGCVTVYELKGLGGEVLFWVHASGHDAITGDPLQVSGTETRDVVLRENPSGSWAATAQRPRS